jgi:hypothetical protein
VEEEATARWGREREQSACVRGCHLNEGVQEAAGGATSATELGAMLRVRAEDTVWGRRAPTSRAATDL